MNRVILGLTGGIASGKSTVSAMLKGLGAKVIDVDAIAREVVEAGTEGLSAVAAEFGSGIIHPDGALDRKRLGRLVFADEAKRLRLNGLLHPLMKASVNERIAAYIKEGAKVIVIDAAVLIEAGLSDSVDCVWLVACREERRAKRIVERDSLPLTQAYERIRSQLSDEERGKYADTVIVNEDSLVMLSEAVRREYAALVARFGVEDEEKPDLDRL